MIDKVKAAGIANRTIILYVDDNGSGVRVHSVFNGQDIQGGKGHPYMSGTRAPMIAWSPGNILPAINNNLVDFTDFLPTIAGIAKVPVPTTYGPIDGVSFYPNLIGNRGTPRSWVFCHYDQNEEGQGINPIQRWVNNSTYKLFDTTGLFYNIAKDTLEANPIPDAQLTTSQKKVKNNFQQVLSTLHN